MSGRQSKVRRREIRRASEPAVKEMIANHAGGIELALGTMRGLVAKMRELEGRVLAVEGRGIAPVHDAQPQADGDSRPLETQL